MIWLFWLACGVTDSVEKTGGGAAPVVEDAPEGSSPSDSLPGISESELGDGVIERPDERTGRQLKRMTIPQVRDSMKQIGGGIPWGDEDASNWDEYADTLGVADYQLRVESDRSPSVMFQKFLDDAASHTCSEWVAAPDSTFFVIDDPTSLERTDVRANIVGLRWQIQGKARDPFALIVDDYEQLFYLAHERAESHLTAWQTVCVAMFTHPDFFMY